jgi:hypothetical protein
VKNNVYYVHREIELKPKATEVFNVEIRDIWVLPEAQLADLQRRVDSLASMLGKTDFAANAADLRGEVGKNLDRIRAAQAENTVGRVQPIQHIRAYEQNLKDLDRVKRDLGHLENLVLATQQDPGGELVGEVDAIARVRQVPPMADSEYGAAVIQITVRNPTEMARQDLSIKRDLPSEIRSYDVIDAGGLEVGTDQQNGVCYVYKEGLAVGPGATLTFNVKVRDKWNVNGPRVRALKSAAEELLRRISTKQQFGAVNSTIRGIVAALDGVAGEKGPEGINDRYVAFYREQVTRLDQIEQKLNRVEAALKPIEQKSQLGFNIPRPNTKTTWLIIYIILGFLALISLLFFLRWYGKTGAEKMSAAAPGAEGTAGQGAGPTTAQKR